MKHIVPISIFLSVLSAAASRPITQGKAEEVRAFGAGVNQCEWWTSWRHNDAAARRYSEEWVSGFITGVMVAKGIPMHDPSTSIAQEKKLHIDIDTYCARHPDDSVANAARSVSETLK